MADTLFDVVRKIGQMLGGSRTGLATGGSTTTIVDTRRFEDDDAFNEGTALILSSTDGEAPQSEWGVISDWVQTTKTATVHTALTAAVGAGDRYMFILPKYPLDQIIDKINQVLMAERIVAIDDTTLDIVADQTEYSLPTGYNRSNLRQVWVETNDDADKPEWMMLQNWHVEYNGSTHLLILDTRIDTSLDSLLNGNDIKLVSCPYHAQVTNKTDTIDDLIHADLLTYGALELLLYDDLANNTGDKWLANRLNWVMDKREKIQAKHPVLLPEWHIRGSGW